MKKEKLLNAIGQIDDDLITEAKPEARAQKKKVKPQWFALLAACLVLVICISVATPLSLGNKEAGKVTMEINPGVEFTIARNGSVKAVRFLNDDAENVLGASTLKGQDLRTAIMMTISAYKAGGYMDRNDTVLVSFNKQLSENKKLRNSVAANVQSALEETNAVNTLVYVNEAESKETAEIAQKYSVSEGKAKLIEEASKVTGLTVEELAQLPLDELVDLQENVDSKVLSTRFIGILRAKQIALKDSGCVNRVTFTEAILVDGGIKTPYYRLVFNDRHVEWTYRIDATSGAIIEKSNIVFFISLEEAKEIALKFANVNTESEEKVVFTKEELSRNQGRPCWILEFYTKEFQYSVKVDAKSGVVFYFDYHIDVREAKEIAAKDAGVYDEFAKLVFTVEEYVGGGIKTPYFYFVFNNGKTQWTYKVDATLGIILEKSEGALFISLEEAKDIALKHANVKAEDAVFTKEELSRNQGRPCWILEFYTKEFQYSVKVDAKSGVVFYFDYHIDVREAKEIAAKDAGVYDEFAKLVFTVEEYVGGGIKSPYFYFVFNNASTQWTYKVDATLGLATQLNKEPITFITLDRAKEIAIMDANIGESLEIVFTTEVLSRNQGRPCWILEFYAGKYQYRYKIDAKSGEIISKTQYIYIEKAKRIALEDVFAEAIANSVTFTVEELIELERTPYFYFVFNDGETQWSYYIDAVDGTIVLRTKEALTVEKVLT